MTTNAAPAIRSPERAEAVRKIFRSVLGKNTPDELFKKQQLLYSDDGKWLYECTSTQQSLAEAVLGVDFPRVAGPVDLDHFTTFANFKSIITSGELQLNPVACNLNYDEFTTFAKEHSLDGYFALNKKGQKVYEELSEDLFFISMTEPVNSDEKMMWREFANKGKGVRLRLRVSPHLPADLRQMKYQTGEPTALKQINDNLIKKQGLTYVPWTISRICAFYLPYGYHPEREVRLLLKQHLGGPDDTIKTGKFRVLPVPLTQSRGTASKGYCDIELIEVHPGSSCKLEAVQQVLTGTPYATTTVKENLLPNHE